jgi:hypothetical protein
MDGFFTERISFASLWITQFCRAAESSSVTNSFGFPPPKKSKKGEIRAFFSVGDCPSEANSSPVEGHCQSSKWADLIAVFFKVMFLRDKDWAQVVKTNHYLPIRSWGGVRRERRVTTTRRYTPEKKALFAPPSLAGRIAGFRNEYW